MKYSQIPANIDILVPRIDLKLPNDKKVTALDTFETNSSNFHTDGLYSTQIFGRVGSDERDAQYGYIDVKLPIFHPFMFFILTTLKNLYGGIMKGTAFAVWNPETRDFDSSDIVNGKTGYQFFMEHYRDIQFKETDSDERREKISVFRKNIDNATTSIVIVVPAGLRDLTIKTSGQPDEEEVNDFYRAILSAANAIPDFLSKDLSTYNNVRYRLQKAFNDVYEYYDNIINGKGGLIQGKWGRRAVNYSTRNVLSAMKVSRSSLNDPSAFSLNHTGVGMFQTLKGTMPILLRQMKDSWLDNVFLDESGDAVVTDPETLMSKSVKVSSDQYDRWNTLDGLENIVNRFKELHIRNKPAMIGNDLVGLVYQDDKVFKFFNNITDLPEAYDSKKVRPITYIELFYTAIFKRTHLLPCFVTRYPVTGDGSIYPSQAHILTTSRSFILRELNDDWEYDETSIQYIRYPDITSKTYVDTLQPHPSRLGGLGADYDGDTGSCTFLMIEDSVNEINAYFDDPKNYINTAGGLKSSPVTEIAQRVIVGMTGG